MSRIRYRLTKRRKEKAAGAGVDHRDTIDKFFLCVGAQKSGTTWLARILADHPDLYLTPVKELHFFDHQLAHNPPCR